MDRSLNRLLPTPALFFQAPGAFAPFFSPTGFLRRSHPSQSSILYLLLPRSVDGQSFPVRQAAWYTKALPTFSDTLAFVRQHLWPSTFFVSRLLNTMS